MYKLHDISAIEGVGPVYSNLFNAEGIKYTEDLITTSFYSLKGKFKGNERILNKLKKFRTHAIFIQLADCGQAAEAFYNAGVDSLSELAWANPQRLTDAIETAKEKGTFNTKLSNEKLSISTLQRVAVETMHTGLIAGTVTNNDDVPIPNAEIFIGFNSVITNEMGRFFFPRLRLGKHEIAIRAEGFKTLRVKTDVSQSVEGSVNFRLSKQTSSLKETEVHSILLGDKFEFIPIELDELNEGDLYYANYLYVNGTVRMTSVKRKKFDNIVALTELKAPEELFENTVIKIADVFRWDNTSFKKIPNNLLELRSNLSGGVSK